MSPSASGPGPWGGAFARSGAREILDHAPLDLVADELPADGAAALFCVERDPEACHRSIIDKRLAAEYDVAVSHLRP